METDDQEATKRRTPLPKEISKHHDTTQKHYKHLQLQNDSD